MQAQWEEFQVNFEAGAQRIERFGPHPAPSAYFDSIVKWAACQLRRICIVAGSVRVEKLELGKLGKQSRHWRVRVRKICPTRRGRLLQTRPLATTANLGSFPGL